MLLKIYEKMLESRINRVPRHIVVVCGSLEKGFIRFAEWCGKFGVEEITLCTHEDVDVKILQGFEIQKVNDGTVEIVKGRKPRINIVAGFTGHDEIVNVIRKLAEMIRKGELTPEAVDEKTIENLLAVKSQPDMIIKAGSQIPEFLIWQGIYSELYFADIDWKNLRYVDFLRILREYQRRERRYGR